MTDFFAATIRKTRVSDFDSGGDDIAATRVGTGVAGLLIKQILKLDPTAFEARGVHVREVVGDRVEVKLLGLHAGSCGVE